MSFKILIVEDQALYADQLEMLIDKLGYAHLATVDNSTDALMVVNRQAPDLILMDIHIRGTHDGIELADLIHQDKLVPIIFITSLQDDLTFARASRTQPVHFLLKPFNNIQLQRAIELTVSKLHETEPASTKMEEWENDFFSDKHFFIKTRQRLEKVAINEVLYIESDGHYTQVHTAHKKFLVRLSTTKLIQKLPETLFVQTHRSFYVNTQKVQSVDLEESIILVGDQQIPLSKRNKDDFLKRLNWI